MGTSSSEDTPRTIEIAVSIPPSRKTAELAMKYALSAIDALDRDEQRAEAEQARGANADSRRGPPTKRDHPAEPGNGERVVRQRPGRVLHLVERGRERRVVEPRPVGELAERAPGEAVQREGEGEAQRADHAEPRSSEREPRARRVATKRPRPRIAPTIRIRLTKPIRCATCHVVARLGDRRELLRLVAAAELLRMDQVVEKEERRARRSARTRSRNATWSRP